MEGISTVQRWLMIGSVCTLTGLTGCHSWETWKGNPVASDRTETETAVVQTGFRQRSTAGETSPEMQTAEEAFQKEDWPRSERLFHRIAENTNTSPFLAEKARYFEAESLRRQGYLPKAADTYSKLLLDFPTGVYRQEAVIRMYDVANFWLEDTRKQMELEQERRDGKRWYIPSNFVHWDRSKPPIGARPSSVP